MNQSEEITFRQKRKARSAKMMLFLAMASIVMVFAGLTSAYVVSKSRPDWLTDFELPKAFLWSTIVILISSATFHLATRAIKKDNRANTTLFLLLTLLFGATFVALQFIGFGEVVSEGYYFTGSESTITTSFLYVIVVAHLAHLFGGMISLLVIIYNHFKQKYNSSQTLGIELGAIYWHFMDFLWLYLFLFFTFYK
ncbi:MAG TPA: cytochrome c oxidase subunit 3 [Flavobacterium sp.]|nr:cytochrome c oxidase subunit 3 [Flavobacterium sp.]